MLLILTDKRHLLKPDEKIDILDWKTIIINADKVKIEALSEDNLIEAISIKNHPSFGIAVQWHAEFEPEKKENYL